MKLKQMVKYRMKMGSSWLTASAACAGVAIFCIALYYFALTDFTALTTGQLILQVILPMLWLVGYVVVLKGIQLNLPLLYGGMGAVYCVLMIIWGFQQPTILGSVGGMVFFGLAGAALVATTMGIIPGKYFIATAFGAVVLMQIFWNDLAVYIMPLAFQAYLPSLSRISGVAALCFLCFGMQGRLISDGE